MVASLWDCTGLVVKAAAPDGAWPRAAEVAGSGGEEALAVNPSIVQMIFASSQNPYLDVVWWTAVMIISNLGEHTTRSMVTAHNIHANSAFVASFEPEYVTHALTNESWVIVIHEELKILKQSMDFS